MRTFKALFALVLAVWALATVYVFYWFRERYGRGGPIPASQAGVLLHPLRPWIHPLRETVEKFGLKPGDTALELGPGPGYFTAEAARVVGPEGRVVCLDLQPEMIAMLRERLDEQVIANAHPAVSDATKLPLADRSVDAAFLVTVLGEVPDRPRGMAELRRVMKPGGVLSICESLTDPDYQLEDSVRDLCRASGFEVLDHSRGRLGYTMCFTAP